MSRETNRRPCTRATGRSWRRQRGKDVRHRRQHRQPGAPTFLAVREAEFGSLAHRRQSSLLRAEQLHQAEHGFGQDKGEALLEALRQSAEVVAGGVVLRPQDHEDAGTLDFDAVGSDVVGERVEGPPRREVEPGMVPVAGQKAVLDGPPVEGKTHVRAAVVHGVRLAIGPEHTDRLGADLAGQAALCLQLLDGPNPGPLRPGGDRLPGGPHLVRLLHTVYHGAAPFFARPVTVSDAAANTTSPLRSRARRAASTSLTSCGSPLPSAAFASPSRGTPATRTSVTGRAPEYSPWCSASS